VSGGVRGLRRTALVIAVASGVLATAGAPALAHGADAPDATAYRTVVTAGQAAPGLTVRAVEAGGRLEMINRTGRTIEVLGYSGEPYLEVRRDGAFENVNSPAAYLNRTLAGDSTVPASASPTAPPQWRRVSDDARVRWHDHRTHWMSDALPAPAVADPTRTHRLRDWVVPLRDGVTPLQVRGTLDWVPPPRPALWWAGALVAAVLCVTARRSRGLLAAVAAVLGTTTLGYAVARELDAGVTGVGGLLGGLLTGQPAVVVVGIGALGAAGLAAARRTVAPFALALAGAGVAVVAGLGNAGVFSQAVAPVPGPSGWARASVLAMVGLGAGLTAAAVLRLRAGTEPTQPKRAGTGPRGAGPDAPAGPGPVAGNKP
jgi:hypothetical protein